MLTQQQRNPEPSWLIIIRLLRWDKPAGRLILIPALWAAFFSTGTPRSHWWALLFWVLSLPVPLGALSMICGSGY